MQSQRFAFAWSALLGYDIFISYRRSDGSAYAEKLWRDLKAAGISPFLDRDETPGGAQLTPSLMRALRRSRMLVVLLTPDVLDSEWVQQEVDTFSRFRGRAIVPINIDNYIGKHNLDGTRLARLKDYSWIEETREGLDTGVPSETVLAEINRGFRKVRVRSISRFITLAVMAGLALAAVIAYAQMRSAQREAEIALAAQTAAQAELIRTQDHSQLDLAASLAFDSLQRNPSPQAEQVVRAALESLPIQIASFQTEAISDLAFAPDGKDILTLSKDSRKASLHSLSGKPVRELFRCPPSEVCQIALAGAVAATAASRPQGGATIRVHSLLTGAERTAFDWESMPATLVLDTSAHKVAAITSEGKACVWSLAAPAQPVCIDGPANAVWQMNANGKLIASRFEDEKDDEKVTWTVWNTETGAEAGKSGGRLHMSQTGKYTVVTSGNTMVRVRNLESGDSLPDFQHEDSVSGVAFNASDRVMATSSSSYRLRMWVFELERPDSPLVTAVAATHRSLRGFTADGMGLLTEAGNPKGGTDLLFWRLRVRDRLIDLAPKQRVHHEGDIYDVAEHPDGTTYATLDSKGVVRVWDTRDGNVVSLVRHEKQPSEEHAAPVCRDGESWLARWRTLWPRAKGQAPKEAYAVDPCGRHFARKTSGRAGRDPELVTVYESGTGREVARLEHSANVNAVSFSPDGRYVVTGGEDHSIKVWDLEANRQAAYIEMETEVRSVRFSEDGRHLIAVGDKDADERYPVATYLWKQEDLVKAMAGRQMRSLSREEWIRFLGLRAKPMPRPGIATR